MEAAASVLTRPYNEFVVAISVEVADLEPLERTWRTCARLLHPTLEHPLSGYVLHRQPVEVPMTLKKLPRTGPWEIDLLPAPNLTIVDVELEGLLLIVEANSGLVRGGEPLELGASAYEPLRAAAEAPVAGVAPGRPDTLRCRQALAPRLSKIAKELGAKIEITEDLPAIDRLAGSLLEHMAKGVPMLPESPEPWREVMGALVQSRIWDHLSEEVCFRFPLGCEILDEALAMVIGQAGHQVGLVVYETAQDYVDFMELEQRGALALGEDFLCWCVHLDRTEDLSFEHVELAASTGMLWGELALNLFAMDSEGLRILAPEEERACLAALQAVMSGWKHHGSALQQGPLEHRAPTALGEILVQTEASRDLLQDVEPLLHTCTHRTDFSVLRGHHTVTPVLTLKMRKADAKKLQALTPDLDAIELEAAGPAQVAVIGWAGGERLGILTETHDHPQLWEEWILQGAGELVITGGGPVRRSYRPTDVISRRQVRFRKPEASEVAPEPMFDPGWRESSDYSGPPETWPKASTVLLDFAQPMDPSSLSPEALHAAIEMAATVWTAVVLADDVGDSQVLDGIRHALRDAPGPMQMVELLIRRKRSEYRDDSRLIRLNDVRNSGSCRVDVNVSWTLP